MSDVFLFEYAGHWRRRWSMKHITPTDQIVAGTFTMLPRVQARMEFARAVGISPLHVWRLTLLPGGGLVGRTGRDWPRAA